MKRLILAALLAFGVSGEAVAEDEAKTCPILGGSLLEIELKVLKKCHPGDQMMIQFHKKISPMVVVYRYCDLRHTVMRDTYGDAEFIACIYRLLFQRTK